MTEYPTDETVRDWTRRLVEVLEREHPEQECAPEGLTLPEDAYTIKPTDESERDRKRRMKADAERRALDEKVAREHLKTETARRIVLEIAERHQVPVADMLSPKRFHPMVRARHAAYVALQDAGIHISAIGRIMKRDHSSVLHGIRKVRAANVQPQQ